MSDPRRTLRLGRPIWLRQSAATTRRYPSVSGRHDTEVAIVGGGITGALVAHAFASAGVATAVLEAAEVGKASTAASSALLLQEPDVSLTRLVETYGARAGRRIWQLSRDSVHGLVELLTRLRIPCALTRRDTLYYATHAQDAEPLHREHALRLRSGFASEWLGPRRLREATAIAGQGAIRTRGNAQFDPYRACVGVMRSAASLGTEVFERSRVRRIERLRDGVELRTPDGVVKARVVVIATGYATPEFRPLAGRFRLYRTYVLSTAPMRAAQRRELGLSDVMVWDTERPYHYARWTPDHRLLLGGGDRVVTPGATRRQQFRSATRELREHFERVFPALTGIDTDGAWEGLFAMTTDSLPYVGPHRRYPGHWFALGYGGNGMTFGFLAARLLVERWHDERSRDHDLFAFDRHG